LFSNHGGRLIDTIVPAIECLEDIINVVDGRAEGRFYFIRIFIKLFEFKLLILTEVDKLFLVFVDTGIRTGTDILKALALGARAVFIGRPILYGLACGGQDGVNRVLEILKRELTYDMACCGLTSIDQINKEILYKHV
jgi:isopentenyl diphosphate isomerase/L-lactate dehydrogenase-like FMN-dependent dehydrogenase